MAEYFLFDPTGDYLEPRLWGFRLAGGRYVRVEAAPEPLPNLLPERQPSHWLYSEQLGLALAYEGMHLRFYDAVSGQPLLRSSEATHLAEAQPQRADGEAKRAEMESRRADAEALARDAADQRAEAEALDDLLLCRDKGRVRRGRIER